MSATLPITGYLDARENLFNRIASWFYPVLIEKARGELGHVLEVNLYQGKVVLDTANVNYSYGSLEDVFDHAFIQTGLYENKIDRALILGFGSGCVAQLLLEKCNPGITVTGVEADREVIRLTEKYFRIASQPGVKIVHADAIDFVKRDPEKYDLVIIDLFIEDLVPQNFQERDFLLGVKKLLNANGKVCFNKMTESSSDPLAKKLHSVFGSVRDVHVHRGGSGNHVYVCE